MDRGILISGTAYDQIEGKLPLALDFAGEQRVKNIERSVRPTGSISPARPRRD